MLKVSRPSWISALISLCLIVPMLIVPPAGANRAGFSDPNDARGRLDMRRLTHGHAGSGSVVHTITMHERFSSRLLRSGFISLRFDTNGDLSKLERRVLVKWRRGALRANVYNNTSGRRVGAANVRRPNRRTVRVTIPVLSDRGYADTSISTIPAAT